MAMVYVDRWEQDRSVSGRRELNLLRLKTAASCSFVVLVPFVAERIYGCIDARTSTQQVTPSKMRSLLATHRRSSKSCSILEKQKKKWIASRTQGKRIAHSILPVAESMTRYGESSSTLSALAQWLPHFCRSRDFSFPFNLKKNS